MDQRMGLKDASEAIGELTYGDRLTREEKAAIWDMQHHVAHMIYSLTPRDHIACETFKVFYQANKSKADIEGIWRMAYAAADLAGKVR